MIALLFLALLPAAQAPKPAVLRGHVVELGSGVPVKRAHVTLRQANQPAVHTTVVTDAQGAFEIRDVVPGAYRLHCAKTGFVNSMWGETAPGRYSEEVLRVRGGEEFKDLEFRLLRAGVVRGTVTDEEGEPIANAYVQLIRRTYSRGKPQYYATGPSDHTDDLGGYRMFGVRPGRYLVVADKRGAAATNAAAFTNYAGMFHPHALRVEDAEPIEVRAGGETRVDFNLRPVGLYRISGRVVDSRTGSGVTKAHVSLTTENYGQVRSSGPGHPVGQDGSFEIKGLVPGNYALTVFIDGAAQGPRSDVSISNQDVTNLVLTLGPLTPVTGRIVDEPGQATPPGLSIVLSPRHSRYGWARGTAQPGRPFHFEVPPGTYEVSVNAPPNVNCYLREVRDPRGYNLLDSGVVVGQEPVQLEFILDHHGGTVSGQVQDESGDPVQQGRVALFLAGAETPPERFFSDRFFRVAMADRAGRFSIRAIIPGDYLLVAWPDTEAGHLGDPEVIAQVRRYARRVRVERDARLLEDVKIAPEVRQIAQKVSP